MYILSYSFFWGLESLHKSYFWAGVAQHNLGPKTKNLCEAFYM